MQGRRKGCRRCLQVEDFIQDIGRLGFGHGYENWARDCGGRCCGERHSLLCCYFIFGGGRIRGSTCLVSEALHYGEYQAFALPGLPHIQMCTYVLWPRFFHTPFSCSAILLACRCWPGARSSPTRVQAYCVAWWILRMLQMLPSMLRFPCLD